MGDIVLPTAPEPTQEIVAPTPPPEVDYQSLTKQIRRATPKDVQEALKPPQVLKGEDGQPAPAPKPLEGRVEPSATPAPTVKPTENPNRQNYKALEDKKNVAEAERDAARKELEEFRRRSTDLEQTLAKARERDQNVAGVELTLREREQELAELRRQLKIADIRRDPEFVEKYQTGRNFHVERLLELGQTAGVPKEDVQRLIRAGDADRLAEVAAGLSPGNQMKFNAALLEIERLDSQRELELKTAETSWERIQRERQERQMQQVLQQNTQYRSVGHKAVDNIFGAIPFIKDNAELRQKCLSAVDGVAGFGDTSIWTPENMQGSIAMGIVLQDINAKQQAVLEQTQSELKALREEHEKLQKVAKERGLVPSDDDARFAPDGGSAEEDYVPFSQRLKVAGR